MSSNLILTIGYVVVVFGAMYFLFIAPQNKQRKAQAEMLTSLKPGDEVVTTGGIFGAVRGVESDRVLLEIADGVVVGVARQAIAARVPEKALGSPAGL